MKLTKKALTGLEHSLRVLLTPEQRLIMLYRYGNESSYGWDDEDFVHGIREVVKQYPDHRQKPLPDFLLNQEQDFNPF